MIQRLLKYTWEAKKLNLIANDQLFYTRSV